MKNTDFIIQDLRMAIDRELTRANGLHGEVLHSKHEAVAVLGEEVDEAQDEARWLGMEMSGLWEAVKQDRVDSEKVESVKMCAENMVAEGIQVIAMCDKWRINADRWEGGKAEEEPKVEEAQEPRKKARRYIPKEKLDRGRVMALRCEGWSVADIADVIDARDIDVREIIREEQAGL